MAGMEEVLAVINQLRKDAEAKVPHPWPRQWPDEAHVSGKGVGYGQVAGLPSKHPYTVLCKVTDAMRDDLDLIAEQLNLDRSTLIRQWLQDAIDDWFRTKAHL